MTPKRLQKIIRLTTNIHPVSLNIFLILCVFILGFLALRNSFTLALSGDDWLLHYTIWSIFYVNKAESFFNPLTYLCTYCPPYGFLGIIEHFWGYTPFYYYFVSYITKCIASIALYFFVKKATTNSYIGLLAAMFSVVSYIGIQTTDWVFNFNHYIGIGIASLFLILYWQAKETSSIWRIIVASLLFGFALVVSPNRMHGLFLVALAAELGWYLTDRERFKILYAVYRIAGLLIAYKILFSGIGYGSVDYNLHQVITGLTQAHSQISTGQTAFLTYPIVDLGNYIFPNLFWRQIPFQSLSIFGHGPFTFVSYFLPVGLLVTSITYFPLKLYNLSKRQTIYYLISQSIWIIFIDILKHQNINLPYDYAFYDLIGGQMIIFTTWYFSVLKTTRPLYAHLLFCSLIWMISFSLFPWLISPTTVLDSEMRYSMPQGFGLAIWISIIFISVLEYYIERKSFLYISIISLCILVFLLGHIVMTNSYLLLVNTYRSTTIDNRIWTQLYSAVPKIDKNAISIFYLTSDPSNTLDNLIGEWDLRFVSFGRETIHYDITDGNIDPFMVHNDYGAVLSSVTDGKELITQGRTKKHIALVKDVYAFKLQNGKLYNVTPSIRTKLAKDLLIWQEHNHTHLQ